jgi:hypothetical protein
MLRPGRRPGRAKKKRNIPAKAALSRVMTPDERDAAAGSDAALVACEASWQRQLGCLQRAHPRRWGVPGLSPEEVRDALTLRLIEAVRAGEEGRPGQAWAMAVMQRGLTELRRRFRVRATPMDLGGYQRASGEEDRWLEREAEALRALAGRRAAESLSDPQRRWLNALAEAARQGAFFAASDAPNLSVASRLLGKNRSSAQRAYRELQRQFRREWERL